MFGGACSAPGISARAALALSPNLKRAPSDGPHNRFGSAAATSRAAASATQDRGGRRAARNRVRPAAVVRPGAAGRLLSTIVITGAPRALQPSLVRRCSSGAWPTRRWVRAIREIRAASRHSSQAMGSWVSSPRRRAWPAICGQWVGSWAPLGDGATRRARPWPGVRRRRKRRARVCARGSLRSPLRRRARLGRGRRSHAIAS